MSTPAASSFARLIPANGRASSMPFVRLLFLLISIDSFERYWQARSLKGFSFLNGVASRQNHIFRAANVQINLAGNHGAVRDYARRRALHCFVRLACLPLRSILSLVVET